MTNFFTQVNVPLVFWNSAKIAISEHCSDARRLVACRLRLRDVPVEVARPDLSLLLLTLMVPFRGADDPAFHHDGRGRADQHPYRDHAADASLRPSSFSISASRTKAFPTELRDAAKVDGLKEWQIFLYHLRAGDALDLCGGLRHRLHDQLEQLSLAADRAAVQRDQDDHAGRLVARLGLLPRFRRGDDRHDPGDAARRCSSSSPCSASSSRACSAQSNRNLKCALYENFNASWTFREGFEPASTQAMPGRARRYGCRTTQSSCPTTISTRPATRSAFTYQKIIAWQPGIRGQGSLAGLRWRDGRQRRLSERQRDHCPQGWLHAVRGPADAASCKHGDNLLTVKIDGTRKSRNPAFRRPDRLSHLCRHLSRCLAEGGRPVSIGNVKIETPDALTDQEAGHRALAISAIPQGHCYCWQVSTFALKDSAGRVSQADRRRM